MFSLNSFNLLLYYFILRNFKFLVLSKLNEVFLVDVYIFLMDNWLTFCWCFFSNSFFLTNHFSCPFLIIMFIFSIVVVLYVALIFLWIWSVFPAQICLLSKYHTNIDWICFKCLYFGCLCDSFVFEDMFCCLLLSLLRFFFFLYLQGGV